MDIPSSSGHSAPTPANSFANSTLHTASSTAPGVSNVPEEDESEHTGGNPASLLANNPALLNLMESRAFGGSSNSGFLETLPPAIRKRVEGLKGLQQEHAKVESEFQLEILALEKKFAARYAPIYARRTAIVSGEAEPTDAEVAAGEAVDDDEEEQSASVQEINEDDDKTKGIPDFWLTALKNHIGINELITEQDEDALRSLKNIELKFLEGTKPGFTLVFHFAPNEYFEDSKLEKTYHYQEEVGYEGDLVYDRAEGTDIKWKEDKDLTKKVEIKKQRNKNTNRTRVVKKVIPADSFFNFFKPPTPPSDDTPEEDLNPDELEDLDERLELDYQIGEDLKERIIPRAIDFYTGKAMQEAFDDLDDSDEFDEDDYGDDDEEEEDVRHPVPGSSQQDPQECKQQ